MGIAATTSKQSAMLPVITAKMSGASGLQKTGNILLDSGAQVSLIRNETAAMLGLKGKEVSITITKVGGEEESISTKEYKVPVSSVDGSSSVSIRAVGIPSISDEVAGVNLSQMKASLGLENELIRRSKGPIDMLIGIDHANIHKGPTKQGGQVVARNTPLCWVIFGGSPSNVSENSHGILHVRL